MTSTGPMSIHITHEDRQQAWGIRERAEKPQNWLPILPHGRALRRDVEPYSMVLDDHCRLIYTVDRQGDAIFKHLTVSVWPGEDPNALVQVPHLLMGAIMEMFGFTSGAAVGCIPNINPMILHAIEPFQGCMVGEA